MKQDAICFREVNLAQRPHYGARDEEYTQRASSRLIRHFFVRRGLVAARRRLILHAAVAAPHAREQLSRQSVEAPSSHIHHQL